MTFLLPLYFFTGCAANRLMYPVSPSIGEFFTTKTADDWQLAVYHYPPQGAANDKPPVVLCHGLNQNYLSWDLSPQYSLARTLTQAGYDVWSVSLRGSGKSTKPGWAQFLELNQPQLVFSNWRYYDYRKFDWNFDDYIQKDMPTLIRFVKEKTGKEELSWIGHSLGGMVLYAYLGLVEDPSIKNAVLISTPGKIPQPPPAQIKMIEKQDRLMRMLLLINTKNISVFSAPFSAKVNVPFHYLWYNKENMSEDIQKRFQTHLVENSSLGVFRQMQLMIRCGEFYSADQKINYTANLIKLKVNLLCVAGKLDNLAPPASVLAIYNAAQSTDKTYRLFGVANGYSADYGHNDILLGKHAPQEVYPYILAWLDRH